MNHIKILQLAAAFVFIQTAFAYFNLTYPSSRGFDESKASVFPCGGFNDIGDRTEIPINSSFIEVNSTTNVNYTYTVNVLVNPDPSLSDFNTTQSIKVTEGNVTHPYESCIKLDFKEEPKVVNAARGTIQVIYHSNDTDFYQCADVFFMDLAVNFNSSMCIDSQRQKLSQSSSSTGTRIFKQSYFKEICSDLVLVSLLTLFNMLIA